MRTVRECWPTRRIEARSRPALSQVRLWRRLPDAGLLLRLRNRQRLDPVLVYLKSWKRKPARAPGESLSALAGLPSAADLVRGSASKSAVVLFLFAARTATATVRSQEASRRVQPRLAL